MDTKSADYEMYTDEGNAQVARLVEGLIEDLRADQAGRVLGRQTLIARLTAGMKEISEAGHGEVRDTAVREAIAWELEKRARIDISIFEI